METKNIPTRKTANFQFISGNLALDFVNTVGNRLSPSKRRDYWQSGKDIVAWAKQAGLADRHQRTPPLQVAITLREALYNIFCASLGGESPRKADLAVLNDLVIRWRVSWKIEAKNGEFHWQFTDAGKVPFPLGPVVESAVELLISADIKRLRQCSDDHCGWLFIDRSQAGRRRWCSMQDCGNRAKVRSFFRRQRGVGGNGAP